MVAHNVVYAGKNTLCWSAKFVSTAFYVAYLRDPVGDKIAVFFKR